MTDIMDIIEPLSSDNLLYIINNYMSGLYKILN
jgi:hypothetical protein